MRAGVLRLAVSSPKSTTPRFSAALRPLGIAFARHASIIPISSQRNAGDVLVSSRANRPQRTLRRQLSSATPEDATIYALSTAPGTAAIAIIRISGTACIDVQYQSWKTSKLMSLTASRYIERCALVGKSRNRVMRPFERYMIRKTVRRNLMQMPWSCSSQHLRQSREKMFSNCMFMVGTPL